MKRGARSALAVLLAVAATAMVPMIANAAETGWLANNMCYFGTVPGTTYKYTTLNSIQKVTAYEDGSYAGNIGLRVRNATTTTNVAWGPTYSSWILGAGIVQFNVSH